MSSYDPVEKEDRQSSHDPGVKEKEVADKRDLGDALGSLSGTDYITFGVVLGVPASGLTMVLVMYFFPSFPDTAAAFLQWLWQFLMSVVS